MPILLGAIADDFTGATDLANTLVKSGMRTVQTIGVPEGEIDLSEAEAIVVALKSRSCPVHEAVESSLAALQWLSALGAQQYFFKYCSTFDSTNQGNIGPVADAFVTALDTDFAIVCPAFPTNQRTIYKGHLFVKDQLLSDSPMKDHPLNPMRDANLVRLMDAQSQKTSGLVPHDVVVTGAKAVSAACDFLCAEGMSYGIVDAITDADLLTIGKAVADHKLITGGSGIALGLPENFRRRGLLNTTHAPKLPRMAGRSIILAGSCSEATRSQITFARKEWPSYKINVDDIASGRSVVKYILDWTGSQDEGTPVIIYASADPQTVGETQAKYGMAKAGEMVETVFGQLAQGLVAKGARRMIVAGGETSGAVVTALNIKALKIGPEIDPGVPWTETLDDPGIALALKSGNFGAEDFFMKALEMLP